MKTTQEVDGHSMLECGISIDDRSQGATQLGDDKMRHRVVLDTDVLVAAAYAPASASRAIVEACLHGNLEAIVSAETVREHRYILDRAVRSGAYGSLSSGSNGVTLQSQRGGVTMEKWCVL